jgi:hypothetical protein
VLICDDQHKHSRIERQAVETGFEQRQLPAIRFAQIRVPTVIVAGNYRRGELCKVPKNRPKLSARAIREHDGNDCQYTGDCCAWTKAALTTSCRSRGGAEVG